MNHIFSQAVHFIGISGIGWLLDFSIYTILSFFSPNLILNNIISSWIGVSFAFCFSTRTVFKNHGSIPLRVKYALYLAYQFLLILGISQLLKVVDGEILKYSSINLIQKSSFIISKILVTPFTMILNFFVMKGLVERL